MIIVRKIKTFYKIDKIDTSLVRIHFNMAFGIH